MAKTLLIENSDFISQITVDKALTESISVSNGKNNTLIVKNVPCTILNRTNQNGRIYSTEEMQKAINEAKPLIARKQLLSQASEHPEGSFVSPTHASHVVTNAYIKKNVKLEVEGESGTWDVLFMDWEVLNTQEGQNLQALLLSECSLGTSIRGLGDMQGDQVVNYELLGVDVVSNPSSGTFTRMPVSESVKLEAVDKNALDEATRYTISTYASNTTHDLQQAIEFQNNAATNLQYGTITNVGTKMDQEVDPDTGVEKIVGEVEVETSDDTSELQTAINAAVKAFTNPNNINVTSVTIEKVDDDDIKDSVEDEAEQPLEEKQTTHEDEEMPVDGGEDGGSTEVTADGLQEAPETEELDQAFMNGEISYEEYNKRLQAQKDKEDAEKAAADQEREQERQAKRDARQTASDEPQETLQDVWSNTYQNETLDYKLDSGYHVEIKPADQESISLTIMGPSTTIKYDNTKDLVEQLKTALTDLVNKNFSLEEKPIIGSTEGDFSEETITEDGDIQVQNNKVVTTIDGEKYEKDFQDKTQAQVAASGVGKGKLDPSVILPDAYDPDSDTYEIGESLDGLSEDDQVDLETLEKLLKQYTDEGNPAMAAALAKAIEQTKAQQAAQAPADNSDEVSNNNEAFKVGALPQTDETPDMKHVDQSDINVKNAVKLDSADTKEVVYTEPDQPSDKLVDPKDKKEEVIVELTDLSYDVDKNSEIQEGSDEEYDSVLEALQGLPETITVTIDASTLSPDSNPLEAILQQANAQTGLPIKNAKIANIKDKEEI